MTERSEPIAALPSERFDSSIPPPPISRTRDILFIVTLIVLSLAVYWPVVQFKFLSYDDPVHITSNPLFNPPKFENIGYYWLHPFYGLYIPLTYTIWTLLGLIAVKAWLFHAANLAVHIGCVLLVYAILRRLVGQPWAALLGAAMFAVHPMQVETVAWISCFRDLLGALFMFAAIWLYLLGRRFYFPVLLAFGLAVLSKPTTVVLPIILLILGLLQRRRWSSLLMEMIPMVLLAVACAIWTKLAQPSSYLRPSPFWSRPLVAMDALSFYLFQLIWPARLGFDYGRTPQQILASGQAYFTWLAPVAVAIILLATSRRQKLFSAAALVFVAGVLPVLGLVPFDFQDKSTVADHYIYVSMLGVSLGIAAIVARRDNFSTRAVVGIVVLAMGIGAWLQTWTWRDTRSLAENGLRVNPRSWSSLNLLASLAFDRDDSRLAERFSREALSIRPDNVDAMMNLGIALAEQKRPAEALEPLKQAVQLRPDLADAHANLAAAYFKLGRFDDAVQQCRIALRINPAHPQAHTILQLIQQATPPPAATQPAPPATSRSRG